MEAPGHEFISENISKFLEEILEIYLKLEKKKEKKKFSKHYFQKGADCNVKNALYLGNWLTDLSQLFAPDLYFDIQYKLNDTLVSLAPIIKESKVAFEKEIEAFCKKYAVSQNAKSKILNKSNYYFNNLALIIENVSQTKITKPKKNDFKYTEKNEWWYVAQSVLKCLGYKKFCMNKKDKISNQYFIDIVSSFIDQSNSKNPVDYLFKLNFYYTSDHLDRTFTTGEDDLYIKQELAKQKAAKSKLSNPKITTKEKQDVIDYEIAMRRNCYDERITNEDGEYDYLSDYKKIIGEKLNIINKDFIIPTFVERKKVSDKDFFIGMARLGHTLHGVEDFFAHSNYLELLVQCMDYIPKQHPELYFSSKDFFALLKKEARQKHESDYEKDRFDLAIKKIDRDIYKNHNNKTKDKVDENNLTTGVFAEGDAYTSIYHNLFGHLHKELDKLDFSIDNEVTDIIVYFIDYLQKYIEKLQNLPQEWKIIIGDEDPISVELLKFIINENSDPTDIKNKKVWNLIDDHQLSYYVDLCNNIIRLNKAIQVGKLVPETVLNFLFVSLSIIFAPLYIEYMLKEILKEFAVAKLLKFIGKPIIEYGLNRVGDYIETRKLGIKKQKMWGTHSVMAKDEEYRNKNWNYQAKRMAIFMDKLVITHMLWGSYMQDTTLEIESVDMSQLLPRYLANPQKYAIETKSEEGIKENNYNEIYIIDEITNKPIAKKVRDLYAYGYYKREKGISEEIYREMFIKLNYFYVGAGHLSIDNMLDLEIAEILKDFPTFNILIVPFQKTKVEIHYKNGQYYEIKTMILDEVLVAAESPAKFKYWMLQFFNKEYYTKFEQDKSFFDRAKVWLKINPNSNEPYKIADTINLFADDPDIIIDIDTAIRMNTNDISNEIVLEKKHKKDMEIFMEKFVKIAYD